jgi:hypothetical protein
VLLSQLQYRSVPVLLADIAVNPLPQLPTDFDGFLAYDSTRLHLQLTGLISAAQRDSLKLAAPALAAQIDALFARSDEFRNQNPTALLPVALAGELVMTPKSADLTLRVLRYLAPLLESDLLAARIAAAIGVDQSVAAALLRRVHVTRAGAALSAYDVLFGAPMLESEVLRQPQQGRPLPVRGRAAPHCYGDRRMRLVREQR